MVIPRVRRLEDGLLPLFEYLVGADFDHQS
jgi:hypothetical protein